MSERCEPAFIFNNKILMLDNDAYKLQNSKDAFSPSVFPVNSNVHANAKVLPMTISRSLENVKINV